MPHIEMLVLKLYHELKFSVAFWSIILARTLCSQTVTI